MKEPGEPRRTPGLRRTPGGKWQARYYDPSGRLRGKTFARKVDAQTFLSAAKADVQRGTWLDPALARRTFGDWAAEFTATRVNLRASTRSRDGWLLASLVLPSFEARPLGSVMPIHVRQWIASLETAGYAPSTVAKAYQTLSTIFKAAVESEMITRSPCRGIDKPKVENGEMRFLSVPEVDQLIEAIPSRHQAFVLTAAYSGLRWGELAALRLPRLDQLRRQLSVEETITRVGGKLGFGPPKTKASIRRISLPAFVVEALAVHLAEHPTEDLVFGSMHPSNFRQRVWNPAVEATVGRPCRFHDLRHSHVAMLIRQGAHPKAIQLRLGHASIKTTLDTYGHLYEGIDEALAEGLDKTWREYKSPGDVA